MKAHLEYDMIKTHLKHDRFVTGLPRFFFLKLIQWALVRGVGIDYWMINYLFPNLLGTF